MEKSLNTAVKEGRKIRKLDLKEQYNFITLKTKTEQNMYLKLKKLIIKSLYSSKMKVIFTQMDHMEIETRSKRDNLPNFRKIVLNGINSIQEILKKRNSKEGKQTSH